MSLRPEPAGPVPEETARVARAAFPRGNVYLRLRDELGALYEDAAFAALFPARGQPAEAPWRLALVTVLQFAEGLSDRQAADAVRGRIDWKYALGLELTTRASTPRCSASSAPGCVGGRGGAAAARRAAGALSRPPGCSRRAGASAPTRPTSWRRSACSTGWSASARRCGHALNALATVAPDWLRPRLARPGRGPSATGRGSRSSGCRKDRPTREALAGQIGADGAGLLRAIYAPDAPGVAARGAGGRDAAPGLGAAVPRARTRPGRPRWRGGDGPAARRADARLALRRRGALQHQARDRAGPATRST